MYTLGAITPANPIPLEGEYLLNLSAACAVALKTGQPVKLNTDGTVSPIAAATDIPFGVCVVGNGVTTDVTKLVTIQTPFRCIVMGTSDAGSAAGIRVACSGQAAGKGKFKTAVATNYVMGLALATATDTNPIQVGIYYNAFLI